MKTPKYINNDIIFYHTLLWITTIKFQIPTICVQLIIIGKIIVNIVSFLT